MKVCYSKKYNFDIGLLNLFHPFDGMKFSRIREQISSLADIQFIEPDMEISKEIAKEFTNALIGRFFSNKTLILRALEFPNIPLLTFKYIDRKVLQPMRWGVGGTITSTKIAMEEGFCWNLSGGYHHASQHSIEGFCIYNDIGIAYQELIKDGTLSSDDKVLIIDTDAHHGNGNARTFIDNANVTILDAYNEDIYPTTYSTRNRVDIAVPLPSGVNGKDYLNAYSQALEKIPSDIKIAFVVAGTDVLSVDKLSGFKLSIDDVVQRERITMQALKKIGTPTVFLGGGGYSKAGALCIARAIESCAELYPSNTKRSKAKASSQATTQIVP